MMKVDFRSDTFTKPTKGMLDAMMSAAVGDDVFSEDPTVNALEEKAAKLFNKEAAIFCPSGTMTNQIAIRLHTFIGAQVICDELSHIYQYEGGGIAVNSLASAKLLKGNRGMLNAAMVEEAIEADDIHKPVTTLVSLENTTNKGGGAIYNFEDILAIKKVCKKHDLKLHVDGARLMNALVATKQSPEEFAFPFDTISLCLSKGLGCPVGSLLIGSKGAIHQARRIRKVLGGGMRQAGFLAAAGIYALDHHVDRLAVDHKRAALIGAALASKSFVEEVLPVESNITIFQTQDNASAQKIKTEFEQKGIQIISMGGTLLRFVTHLDINDQMMDYTLDQIHQL